MSKTSVDVGGITKGVAIAYAPDAAFINYEVRTEETIICTMGIDMSPEEEAANAALYAEAHNVANECCRSPRQLLEERDRAVELLRSLNCVTVTETLSNGDLYFRDNDYSRSVLKNIVDFLNNLPTNGK